MIGVVVLPNSTLEMLGLDEVTPVSLLPLVDRPFLQHVIEFLALQGITSFEFILEHAPEEIESYLGDGARWGCRFRCHLVSQVDMPYRCLRIIPEVKNESTFLVHADQVPYIHLSEYGRLSQPVLFRAAGEGKASTGLATWGGGVLFPNGIPVESIANCSRQTLGSHFDDLESQGLATSALVKDWISVRTPQELLQSQRRLLNGEFPDLMIGGTENDPKLWVSRNVVIHPSAKIVPPVFLGPNARIGPSAQIGPSAVVSSNSVIDAHTSITNSLVTAGSYIGERLELDGVIVDRNLLVNVKLGTGVTITEDFLLGRMAGPIEHRWFASVFESLLAVILMVLFLPFYLALGLYLLTSGRRRLQTVKVVCLPAVSDPRLWRTLHLPVIGQLSQKWHRSAGWLSFFCIFLPGLPAVAAAKLNLVGLPPRTGDEVRGLPPDWRSLYLRGKIGLITEASLVVIDPNDGTERYLAEACYRATSHWKHDLALFTQYFLRLIVHRHQNADIETESQT